MGTPEKTTRDHDPTDLLRQRGIGFLQSSTLATVQPAHIHHQGPRLATLPVPSSHASRVTTRVFFDMNAFSARNLSLLAVSLLCFTSCGGGGGSGAPVADPIQSSFTVNHSFGQIADGSSTVDFYVTLADTQGNPLVDTDIAFLLTGYGNVLRYDTTTDANGQVSGDLATRVAEAKTLTCLVGTGPARVTLGELTIEFVRAQANARYLRANGPTASDANDGLTPISAWRTLDHALGQIGAGDTLYVGAGEYAGGLSHTLQAADDAPLTILGDATGIHTGDAGDVVILGAGMAYGLEIADAANLILRGLVLRGSDPGIGISLRGTTRNISIVDCDLYENERAIVTETSDALLIEGNRISNNTGDGIVLGETQDARILHNLVYNNTLSGVVLASISMNIMFANNTFYRNGGDHFREEQFGGTGTVTGNILVEGGSLSVRLLGGSSFQRSNNLIFANAGDPGSPLDLEADPLFVDPFGADGILGGPGASDDDFRVLDASQALDAGLETAANTIFPFSGPAATRTSRSDATPDGMGPDGSALNLGYHYPVALDPIASLAPGNGRLAFASDGDAFVHTRTYDTDGTWGTDDTTHGANHNVKWIVNRARSGEQPDEAQAVLIDTGTTAQLYVRTWDGRQTSEDFTHPITTYIQSANSAERGFDIEFEALTGDLLLVHSGPDANPFYRVWSNGTWSTDQEVFNLGTAPGTTLWIQLVERPGTDDIALVALDDQMRVVASIWDGSSWNSPMLLGTEIVETRDYRAFDVAWESNSGDLLVAWGFSPFAEQTRYATRSAQTGLWTTGQFTSTDAIAAHLRMESDPASDRIVGIFGEGTDDDDITASIWDGDAWTDTIEFTLTGFAGSRAMQAAWLGDSGDAIAIYRDGDLTGDLNFAIFNNGWRVQPQVFLPGPGRILQAEIVQREGSDGVSVLLLDQQGSLYDLIYEGGKWSLGNDGDPLATNLDTQNPGRAFSLAKRGL